MLVFKGVIQSKTGVEAWHWKRLDDKQPIKPIPYRITLAVDARKRGPRICWLGIGWLCLFVLPSAPSLDVLTSQDERRRWRMKDKRVLCYSEGWGSSEFCIVEERRYRSLSLYQDMKQLPSQEVKVNLHPSDNPGHVQIKLNWGYKNNTREEGGLKGWEQRPKHTLAIQRAY